MPVSDLLTAVIGAVIIIDTYKKLREDDENQAVCESFEGQEASDNA